MPKFVKADQFELSLDSFNLAGETTIDGEAQTRELARKAREAEEAHADFRKHQRDLFGLSA